MRVSSIPARRRLLPGGIIKRFQERANAREAWVLGWEAKSYKKISIVEKF